MACSPQAQGASSRGRPAERQPPSRWNSGHKRCSCLGLSLTKGCYAPHSVNTTQAPKLMLFHRVKPATQKGRVSLWKSCAFCLRKRGEINKTGLIRPTNPMFNPRPFSKQQKMLEPLEQAKRPPVLGIASHCLEAQPAAPSDHGCHQGTPTTPAVPTPR